MLQSAPIFYWSKIPRIVSCHWTAWFQSATARREGSWCSLLRRSWCFVYHRQAAAKVLKNECMSLQVVIINIAKITYQFQLYPKSYVMVLWLGGGRFYSQVSGLVRRTESSRDNVRRAGALASRIQSKTALNKNGRTKRFFDLSIFYRILRSWLSILMLFTLWLSLS